MAKKKFDPKAKEKRQKIILAVGGVLLLGLLAFQVPRTLKMMHPQDQSSSSSSTSASTTTGTSTTPLAPPSLDGSSTAAPGAGSSTATSSDGISDPSNPLPPNAGQLISFSKFKSKDPFHQQITAGCESTSGTAACASTSPSGTTKPAVAPPSRPTATPGATKPVATKPTKATILVNNAPSSVSVGGAFPSASPVFMLVSLTRTTAKIGIAGGTYANGAATVTLAKGKPVTLMNTADGTRYVLELVAVA
jgi:hypothetical protein